MKIRDIIREKTGGVHMDEKEKKEIAKIRDELREELSKKNNADIREITYYTDFQLINKTGKYMGFNEKDIFIVEKEEKKEGKKVKTYEIYNKDKEKLAGTDDKGLMELEPQYKEILKEKLKDYYKMLGLEDKERKMYLHEQDYVQERGKEREDNFVSKEKGFVVSDKPKEELSKEEKTQELEQIRKNRDKKVDMLEPALLENDLGLNTKDIGSMIKIKDKRFYQMVPEARKYDGDAILAYCKSTNKFMIIGMENGKYVECDGVDPSVGTMKTSVDLDRTGEHVEKQAIGSVMKIKGNNDYDFAVNLEPGGSIEFQELRKDKDGKYISADLQVQGQYATSWEVEKMMDKNKNRYIYDEREEFETEQRHKKRSSIQSLKEKECTKEEKEGKEHDEDRERSIWDHPNW